MNDVPTELNSCNGRTSLRHASVKKEFEAGVFHCMHECTSNVTDMLSCLGSHHCVHGMPQSESCIV